MHRAAVLLSAAMHRRGDVLSVAPMMDWTDRHFRYLVRLLSARTVLYTEMVVDQTLLHSPRAAGYLRHSPAERPLVAQLGGSDPAALAAAAAAVRAAGGFDGINLNCGCPSPRVAGRGSFGAALMQDGARVAAAVQGMAAAAGPALPITVKCRLGVDGMDSYAAFAAFLAAVSAGGACTTFIVHARRALTRGLSPKDNRTVPPLRYHWVQRAALEFPHLSIGINGGVERFADAAALLLLRRAPPAPAAAAAAEEEGCAAGAGAIDGNDAAPLVQLGADGFPKEPMLQLAIGVARQPYPPPGVRRLGQLAEEAAAAAAAAAEAAEAAAVIAAAEPPVAEPVAGAPAPQPPRAAPRRRSAFDEHPSAGCPSVLSLLAARGSDGLLTSVMLGRIAYSTPWMLADADRVFFGERNPGLSRREVIAAYLRYATEQLPAEVPAEEMESLPAIYAPHVLMKPLLNLFHGCAGGARFRAALTTAVNERKLGLTKAVAAALEQAPLLEADLDERPPRD